MLEVILNTVYLKESMSSTLNTAFAKFAVAFVAIAMMFSVVAPASAQSVDDMSLEELIALVTQLQAQLGDGGGDTMSGGSTASVCPYTWTRDLSAGSTGADVMALQQFLNSMPETQVAPAGSAGGPGMETSYYGPATGAAVANFQMMYRAEILTPLGLVNPTQYFGAGSRAQANALCTTPVAPTPGDDMSDEDGMDDEDDDDAGSPSLGNDEGSIEAINQNSPDDSSVEEGQLSAIFEFELEIEGDLEVDRLDLYVDNLSTGTQSDDADDYFTEAQLWVDGEEVASLDVEDWDEDDYSVVEDAGNWTNEQDEFRLRFSSLGLVFEDGDEPVFVLGLVGTNNVDSDDLDETWGVQMDPTDSIRFVDGQGFTGTEGDDIFETFSFEEEETAELDISESSDSPDPAVLKIDDGDQDSDEFDVFVFEIEERNGVDAMIEDMTFEITTTGSTTESDVVEEVILYQGSTELASERVPTGTAGGGARSVEFENLGIEIGADDTEEFTVAMIFKGSEEHGNASAVTVALTSIDEAEDENGNDEGEMNEGAGAGEDLPVTSEEHTLRTVVPVITDVDSSIDRNEATTAGTISFNFMVGADDDDVTLAVADNSDVQGDSDAVRFTLTGGPATTTATATMALVSGDAEYAGGVWTVQDGEEAEFALDIAFDGTDGAGTYRANLETVGGVEIDETSTGMTLVSS